ncbi:MAG: hypothetical protein IPJ76_11380 [Flavobacteriales bacterium]|nr:MAG: hypothetical protein IPJ76_11380 [Flavobacteriales bacterium]
MNWLRKLIPGALQRYDLYLQQSKPRLWATRFHYHIWFILLLNVLVFVFGMLLHVDKRSFPDPEEFFGWMTVPAIFYCAFWVYKVVLFTLERRNGLREPFAEVGEFMVHLLSIVLIWSLPYNIALTLSWRIDRIISDEQFVQEVDDLNEEAFMFLTGDGRALHLSNITLEGMDPDEINYLIEDGEWYSGTGSHAYFRSLDEYNKRLERDPEKEESLQGLYDEYKEAYNAAAFGSSDTRDPHKAKRYLAKMDSIERNFPLYFVAHGPFSPEKGWTFTYDLRGRHEVERVPFLSDSLLEARYVKQLDAPDMIDRERIANVLAIADSYRRDTSGCTVDSALLQFNERKQTSSMVFDCDRQIERLWEAKTMDYSFARFWAMFYTVVIMSFCLALLIGIFKNIYWQPFLIGFVVCFLTPIVLVCVAFLVTWRNDYGYDGVRPDDILLYGHYFIGIFLLAQAPFVFRLKAYRTSRAVMTIIANCIAPFILFTTLMILEEEFDIFGVDALWKKINEIENYNGFDLRLPALRAEAELLREKVFTIMQIFLWGGMALYLFVGHGFFRSLMARLTSLPERK